MLSARPARERLAGLVEALRERRVDAVTLTSSEGLDNLWAIFGAESRGYLAATPAFVPHPRIAEHARALGLREVFTTPPTDAGLIAALLEYFATHPTRAELNQTLCNPTSSSPRRCRRFSTIR